MGKLRVIYINRKVLFPAIALIAVLLAVSFILFRNSAANNFIQSYTKTIVIDPGHGGIDGGAFYGGMKEKDINLDIAKRVKDLLEQNDYKVILTREKDQSLDSLITGGGSRHQRDLTARADIINNSKAQLFLSIHGNCHVKNLEADGSIVLYNERFVQNKALAYSIQRALNDITINGIRRTVHDPQNKTSLYLLNATKIPGIIIETAFISNRNERQLLMQDAFKDEIAKAILAGVDKYFEEIRSVWQ